MTNMRGIYSFLQLSFELLKGICMKNNAIFHALKNVTVETGDK